MSKAENKMINKFQPDSFESNTRSHSVEFTAIDSKEPENYSSNPYHIINQFFLDGTIEDARDDLNRLFEAAFPDKILYKKHYPPLLIRIFGRIDRLIDAAYAIYLKGESKEPIGKSEMDSLVLARVKLLYMKFKDWNYFPHKLSPYQWINPRIAIRDFFEFQPISHWKGKLHEFLLASVSDESICYLISDRSRLYLDCQYLERLVESLWLIKVTEL